MAHIASPAATICERRRIGVLSVEHLLRAMIRKVLTIFSLVGLLITLMVLAGTSHAPLLSIAFGTLFASALTLLAVLAAKLVRKLRGTQDRRIMVPGVVVLAIFAVVAAYWASTHAIAAYRWHHPLANRDAKRMWLEDREARLREGDAMLLRETWEEQDSWLCPEPQRYGIRKILLSVIETPKELNLPEFRSIESDTEIPNYFSWTDWINDNWDIIGPWIEHHLDELRFDPSSRKYKLHQNE